MPAFSPKDDIGKHRNVVVKLDPCLTLRACGWRFSEIHIPGEPEDDDIEKTSPGKANE